MTVTLYEANGTPRAGEAAISQPMKELCDQLGGYIKDDTTNDVIYPEEG